MQWVPQKPPSRVKWSVYALATVPIVIAIVVVVVLLAAIEANQCCP
jgi:hypothetical protein